MGEKHREWGWRANPARAPRRADTCLARAFLGWRGARTVIRERVAVAATSELLRGSLRARVDPSSESIAKEVVGKERVRSDFQD